MGELGVTCRYGFEWGQFHFCIMDTEHDWRIGTEQYKFIDECLGSVDRQKQPWLIFLAHRVMGYSSGSAYGNEGTFAEPESRDHLENLWQKHKVDLAYYGHVHQYERTCPVFEVIQHHTRMYTCCNFHLANCVHACKRSYSLSWKISVIPAQRHKTHSTNFAFHGIFNCIFKTKIHFGYNEVRQLAM